MSEDVLTSESEWPELAELDGFWDDDPTPPRGVPIVDVAADVVATDDDPTPVNAPRPVLQPTLPPPTSAPVAGPVPAALHLQQPTPDAPVVPRGRLGPAAPPPPIRRGLRWVGAVVLVGAVAVAGLLGWQWNERRHDAASAPQVLPTVIGEPTIGGVIEFEIDRAVDVRVWADLDDGEVIAEVADRYWIARTGDGYLTREGDGGEWTPATPALLRANTDVVDLLDDPTPIVLTDLVPSDVHDYIDIADDREVDAAIDPGRGPTALAVDRPDAVRRLTLRIDRRRLTDDQPLRAELLGLAGGDPAEIIVWVDRTGLVHRVTAPVGVTTIGGSYALVAVDVETRSPLDAVVVDDSSTAPGDTASDTEDAQEAGEVAATDTIEVDGSTTRPGAPIDEPADDDGASTPGD